MFVFSPAKLLCAVNYMRLRWLLPLPVRLRELPGAVQRWEDARCSWFSGSVRPVNENGCCLCWNLACCLVEKHCCYQAIPPLLLGRATEPELRLTPGAASQETTGGWLFVCSALVLPYPAADWQMLRYWGGGMLSVQRGAILSSKILSHAFFPCGFC